jgi:hypothetical protein
MSAPRAILHLVLIAALLGAGALGTATACPICGQPTVTFAERYAGADAALLVEWVSAMPARDGTRETTTYEVVEVHRGPEGAFKKGQRLTVDESHSGKPGSLVFLFGNKTEAGEIKWDHPPLDVTETSAQYIVQAPSPETPRAKRLEYFVRFLEYPDTTIANDAFAEFANAPSEDIFAIAGKLPREKLRRWLLDAKTPPGRQAGYGLMLGLCGTPQDVALLEGRILDESGERRVGVEGLIVGYLLLTGEKGLAVLEKARLKAPGTEVGELFALQAALRYFWSYGAARIPRESVEATTRLLLDNATFATGTITDLARWKDWSVQSRLMRLYGAPDFDDDATRNAIIGYMIASTKDVPKNAAPADWPRHAREGAEYLRQLRDKDPKRVAEAEKYFHLK